ncbi:MAG: hypothetical protein HY587_05440 [Candidatus Omnitrophica bacterium]|nr:hypothetical protein [Candidatus Omnitrophota bacterium]
MLPQNNLRPPGWYFKFWGMVLLLILFGPLAFPFLWASKTISRRWKLMLTVFFTAATVWVVGASINVYKEVLQDLREAGLMR